MCTHVMHAHPPSHTCVYPYPQKRTCPSPQMSELGWGESSHSTAGANGQRNQEREACAWLFSFASRALGLAACLPASCLRVSLLQPTGLALGPGCQGDASHLSSHPPPPTLPPPRLNTLSLCESHQALVFVQLSSVQRVFTHCSSPRTTLRGVVMAMIMIP